MLVVAGSLTAEESQVKAPASHTQVVLLGTGSPPADPDRSGPATAIVVNGTPYLVDLLRPVVDRQRSRPEVLLSEITARYSGPVVVGRDLDVF
ncbi:MAG TPA: hypothetical protein VK864_01860 [Longimicrobiales bacterium]|nr:hypothetical protein [Longimicrobiales bacterium]